MARLDKKVAAMASTMLDAELSSVVSKIRDEDNLTLMQSAIMAEWLQRKPRLPTS